jgi:hypothetical protein
MQSDGSLPKESAPLQEGDGSPRGHLVLALAGAGVGLLPLIVLLIEIFSPGFGVYWFVLTYGAFWFFAAVAVVTPVCLLVRRLRPAGWGLLFAVSVSLIAAWVYFHTGPPSP